MTFIGRLTTQLCVWLVVFMFVDTMDAVYPEPLSRLYRRAVRKQTHRASSGRYRTQPVTFAEIKVSHTTTYCIMFLFPIINHQSVENVLLRLSFVFKLLRASSRDGMTSWEGLLSREEVCGTNAVQFQSCDGSSYCTALGENGCTDIVSCPETGLPRGPLGRAQTNLAKLLFSKAL